MKHSCVHMFLFLGVNDICTTILLFSCRPWRYCQFSVEPVPVSMCWSLGYTPLIRAVCVHHSCVDLLRITPQSLSLFSSLPDKPTGMFTLSLIQEWSGRVFWYAAWRHYANGLLNTCMCVDVCLYMYMGVFVRVRARVGMCVCACMRVWACLCVRVTVWVRIRVCAWVCPSVRHIAAFTFITTHSTQAIFIPNLVPRKKPNYFLPRISPTGTGELA